MRIDKFSQVGVALSGKAQFYQVGTTRYALVAKSQKVTEDGVYKYSIIKSVLDSRKCMVDIVKLGERICGLEAVACFPLAVIGAKIKHCLQDASMPLTKIDIAEILQIYLQTPEFKGCIWDQDLRGIWTLLLLDSVLASGESYDVVNGDNPMLSMFAEARSELLIASQLGKPTGMTEESDFEIASGGMLLGHNLLRKAHTSDASLTFRLEEQDNFQTNETNFGRLHMILWNDGYSEVISEKVLLTQPMIAKCRNATFKTFLIHGDVITSVAINRRITT